MKRKNPNTRDGSELAEIKFETRAQVVAFLKEHREHLVIEIRRKTYIVVATFKSMEDARDCIQRLTEAERIKEAERIREAWDCIQKIREAERIKKAQRNKEGQDSNKSNKESQDSDQKIKKVRKPTQKTRYLIWVNPDL